MEKFSGTYGKLSVNITGVLFASSISIYFFFVVVTVKSTKENPSWLLLSEFYTKVFFELVENSVG